MGNSKQTVIMRVEPSTRLSEILGFPYFIERSFTMKELLEKKVINKSDVRKMVDGREIHKKIPIG